ncbi:hypothetical protein WA026_013281 [Henosepilachna vigintioctopunctata]|uniref:Reverse transcriptase domain-containing protein n=1 Tax=Henosepilachna vigintioctopunctata TaxID=420089 RepID=A0AAW1UKA1_9CUCU
MFDQTRHVYLIDFLSLNASPFTKLQLEEVSNKDNGQPKVKDKKTLVRHSFVEGFRTSTGLRQGRRLSPALFNVHMDHIIKKSEQKVKKMFIGHKKLERVDVAEGVFADDVVLLAGSENRLQENLNLWKAIWKKKE